MEATDNKIWLIGEISSSLPEENLTVRDVLRVYFYYRRVVLKPKKMSVNVVAKDLITQQKNLGITTIAEQDLVRKINIIIVKYDAYKKSMHRDTPKQRDNEKKFISFLNESFAIVPKPNYHCNKKHKLDPESLKCETVTKAVQRSDSSSKTEFNMCAMVFPEFNESNEPEAMESDSNLNSDFDMCEIEDSDCNKSDDLDFENTLSKYQKSKFANAVIKEPGVMHKIINSAEVSSVLDRTNYSNPKFTLLCAAIAHAIGEDLNECVLSTSTCYRRRITHRDRMVTVIRDDFMSTLNSNLVLHWDGKKLRDTTNDNIALRQKRVERLAVVVSGVDVQKIITIAKLEDGTGLMISDTVYEHVVEWNVLEAIIAVCTDTTASNTGRTNGSVVLFQQLLGRNVLYLACRHHVLELIIGAVFEKLFGETTGPSPEMFENFKRDWHLIDQTSFKPLDMRIFKGNTYISRLRNDIIIYVESILATKDKNLLPKGDYMEMLELCLLILGKPIPNYTFHVPHACSHSRWMSKIIYTMKEYLFRDQIHFTKAELKNLKDICIFICLIYIKNWIQCCIPSNAPHNDLTLIKELERYAVINKDISESAIEKFYDHLWYLGSELVILSLFSDKVTDLVKHRMFEKIKILDNGIWTERSWRLMDYNDLFKKDLDDLVNASSMSALKSLKLDIKFMYDNEVSDWKNLDSYKTAKKTVDSLQVVNDCAERTLKLMTDFNESFTSNEDKMQQAIQVIEDNRKRIPNTKKSVLSVYKKHNFE